MCVCVLNGLISDSLTLVRKLRDTVVGFIFLLLSALEVFLTLRHDNNRAYSFTIRYDTRCYFNVRSKADISQLNLPHGTDN